MNQVLPKKQDLCPVCEIGNKGMHFACFNLIADSFQPVTDLSREYSSNAYNTILRQAFSAVRNSASIPLKNYVEIHGKDQLSALVKTVGLKAARKV